MSNFRRKIEAYQSHQSLSNCLCKEAFFEFSCDFFTSVVLSLRALVLSRFSSRRFCFFSAITIFFKMNDIHYVILKKTPPKQINNLKFMYEVIKSFKKLRMFYHLSLMAVVWKLLTDIQCWMPFLLFSEPDQSFYPSV